MLTPNDEIVKKSDIKPLKAAQLDDDRHRLHAESATSEAAASPYFKRWVKNYINPVITAKAKRDQLLRQFAWPPVSVHLVDEIIDMTGAVHNGQDKYRNVALTDERHERDFNLYGKKIGLDDFFTRDCHTALFAAPNSFVVVDLPAVQVTPFPEPYVYLLDSHRVRAAKPKRGTNAAGLLEFCWFETDQPGVTFLYDEVDFSVWKQQSGAVGEWLLVSQTPHNLPFCPVFKMWDDVEVTNPLTSNTILRPLLSMLDRYMFWDAATESNDLASAFMMLWHLKESQRKDPIYASAGVDPVALLTEIPGTICRPTGVLDDGTPYQSLNNLHKVDDDKVSRYGPGTAIPIDAPQSKDDADWRVPAGWIAPPVENLEYIANKAIAFKHAIRTAATGYEAPTNGQAINETQVMSIVERSRLIYQYLAPHYEVLEIRVLTCLVSLMFGPDVIRDITVSYGTRFSMLTGRELAELLKIVKDAQLNVWLVEELNQLQQEYYSRNDPKRKLRFKMLDDLTDYPNVSENQLKSLGIDQTDPEGFQLKISLLGFVYRFERENGLTLEEFGSIGIYEDRINQIKLRFKAYGSERKPRPEQGSEQGSGNANPVN